MLYKKKHGESLEVPFPRPHIIREPTNAILKTQAIMKTPSVPFVIQS